MIAQKIVSLKCVLIDFASEIDFSTVFLFLLRNEIKDERFDGFLV